MKNALSQLDEQANVANVHAERARKAEDIFARLGNFGLGPIAGLGQEISRSIADAFEKVSGDYARLPKDAQAVVTEATKMVMEATAKKHLITHEEFSRIDELFQELLKVVGKYKGKGLAAIEAKINEIALQLNQIITSLLFEKHLTAGQNLRHKMVKGPKKSYRKSPRKSLKK